MNIIQFNDAAAAFGIRVARSGASKVKVYQEVKHQEPKEIDEVSYNTWRALTYDFTFRDVRKFIRRAYKIVETTGSVLNP